MILRVRGRLDHDMDSEAQRFHPPLGFVISANTIPQESRNNKRHAPIVNDSCLAKEKSLSPGSKAARKREDRAAGGMVAGDGVEPPTAGI